MPVKQGSPFYAEPADSLAANVPRRVVRPQLQSLHQRHSNPAVLQDHHITSGGLERIDSGDILNGKYIIKIIRIYIALITSYKAH